MDTIDLLVKLLIIVVPTQHTACAINKTSTLIVILSVSAFG